MDYAIEKLAKIIALAVDDISTENWDSDSCSEWTRNCFRDGAKALFDNGFARREDFEERIKK